MASARLPYVRRSGFSQTLAWARDIVEVSLNSRLGPTLGLALAWGQAPDMGPRRNTHGETTQIKLDSKAA
jgi:hypothetical protein